MSGVTIDKLHTPKLFVFLVAADNAAAQMATGKENPSLDDRTNSRCGAGYKDVEDGWSYVPTSTGVSFGYHVAVYDETGEFLGYI